MILSPGATIGILGAGQLGRMLAIAALKMGLRTHIFAPEAEAPAYDAAAGRTIAAFDDEEALARFAEAVDVVTFEFENVPTADRRVPGRAGPGPPRRARFGADPGPGDGKDVPARYRTSIPRPSSGSRMRARWRARSPNSAAPPS